MAELKGAKSPAHQRTFNRAENHPLTDPIFPPGTEGKHQPAQAQLEDTTERARRNRGRWPAPSASTQEEAEVARLAKAQLPAHREPRPLAPSNRHCSRARAPGQTRPSQTPRRPDLRLPLRPGAAPSTRTHPRRPPGARETRGAAKSGYGPAEWCSIRHRRPNRTPRPKGGSRERRGGQRAVGGGGRRLGAGRTLARAAG
jgi:hypothetical protein